MSVYHILTYGTITKGVFQNKSSSIKTIFVKDGQTLTQVVMEWIATTFADEIAPTALTTASTTASTTSTTIAPTTASISTENATTNTSVVVDANNNSAAVSAPITTPQNTTPVLKTKLGTITYKEAKVSPTAVDAMPLGEIIYQSGWWTTTYTIGMVYSADEKLVQTISLHAASVKSLSNEVTELKQRIVAADCTGAYIESVDDSTIDNIIGQMKQNAEDFNKLQSDLKILESMVTEFDETTKNLQYALNCKIDEFTQLAEANAQLVKSNDNLVREYQQLKLAHDTQSEAATSQYGSLIKYIKKEHAKELDEVKTAYKALFENYHEETDRLNEQIKQLSNQLARPSKSAAATTSIGLNAGYSSVIAELRKYDFGNLREVSKNHLADYPADYTPYSIIALKQTQQLPKDSCAVEYSYDADSESSDDSSSDDVSDDVSDDLVTV